MNPNPYAPLPIRQTSGRADLRENLYIFVMTALTFCLFPLVFLLDGSDKNSDRIYL
jgi:hypothetical protein